MAKPSAREAVIDAARQLFGERGYSAVTVKDVAALAGYSPAMVMKVMGSKAKMYAAAAPEAPNVDLMPEKEEPLGFALVRRILRRRGAGELEPWAMVGLLVQDTPDPDAARVEVRENYVRKIAARIGDTTPNLQKSQLVVCAVMGLGAGIRVLGLLDASEVEDERLIQHYGALVQGIIDDPALV